MIQTLEDMLQTYALDSKKAWDEQLVLIEFSYNNTYHFSIRMAPYEALYIRQYRILLCWQEIDEALTIRPDLIQVTAQKIRVIQDRMKASQSCQKSHDNKRHTPL